MTQTRLPLDEREMLRLLTILGHPYLPYYNEQRVEQFIGIERYKYIQTKCLLKKESRIPALMDACFDEENGMEFVNDRTIFGFSWNILGDNKVVIFDPFCQKGEWLSSFYTLKTNLDKSNFFLIGNEINEKGFKLSKKAIGNNGLCFSKNLEELELPSESISLLLFNPPTGMASQSLNTILEKNWLIKTSSDIYRNNFPLLVGVLSGEDLILSLETILSNFEIKALYRMVDQDIYELYHQFMIIAVKREMSITAESAEFQEVFQKVSQRILDEGRFGIGFYGMMQTMNHFFESVDVDILFANLEYMTNRDKYLSRTNSSALSWAKLVTQSRVDDFASLTMPKSPKPSEISLLIAAGSINGIISKKDGSGKHIAVGGVRSETSTTEEEVLDEHTGNVVYVKKTVKQSIPYLKVLYSDKDGKAVLKEIK